MTFTTSHILPFDQKLVWDWHTRPGAVKRLTPPFVPMSVEKEATSLADGTTTFLLPGKLQWVAQHQPSGYIPKRRFTDVCVSPVIKGAGGWRHTHTFADAPEGATLITDYVDSRIPISHKKLRSVFAYRQHQLYHDLAFSSSLALTSPSTKPLTIAVTGASGLVGRALTAQLTTLGHAVIPLVRKASHLASTTKHAAHPHYPLPRFWNSVNPAPDLLDSVDVLVHLAGEPILGRFSQKHQSQIRDSRVIPTLALAKLVSQSSSCSTMVCASAIGFYGFTTMKHNTTHGLTETGTQGDGFLANVVAQWESACAPAHPKRVVNVRTGIVLSAQGGVLPPMAALFSTGLGGRLGSGKQWMSWIALDDLTDIYVRAIIDPALSGPVNATAPTPVRNSEFTTTLAQLLHRPSLIPTPAWAPGLLVGKQGTQELVLADQKVLPAKITNHDHNFRYPTLRSALAHELGKESLF